MSYNSDYLVKPNPYLARPIKYVSIYANRLRTVKAHEAHVTVSPYRQT